MAAASSSAAGLLGRNQAEEQARALLDRCLVGQNEGKNDPFLLLYAKDFVGIRRTPSGEERRLAVTEWEGDRRWLFDKPQKV